MKVAAVLLIGIRQQQRAGTESQIPANSRSTPTYMNRTEKQKKNEVLHWKTRRKKTGRQTKRRKTQDETVNPVTTPRNVPPPSLPSVHLQQCRRRGHTIHSVHLRKTTVFSSRPKLNHPQIGYITYPDHLYCTYEYNLCSRRLLRCWARAESYRSIPPGGAQMHHPTAPVALCRLFWPVIILSGSMTLSLVLLSWGTINITPFRNAVPFRWQTTYNLSGSSPNRTAVLKGLLHSAYSGWSGCANPHLPSHVSGEVLSSSWEG